MRIARVVANKQTFLVGVPTVPTVATHLTRPTNPRRLSHPPIQRRTVRPDGKPNNDLETSRPVVVFIFVAIIIGIGGEKYFRGRSRSRSRQNKCWCRSTYRYAALHDVSVVFMRTKTGPVWLVGWAFTVHRTKLLISSVVVAFFLSLFLSF